MTSPESTRRDGARRLWPWLVAALIALIVIDAFLAWGPMRPLGITVDGVPRTVSPGSTLLDLQDQGLLNSERGVLLSLQGKAILARGGAAAIVTRNGRSVSLSQRLFDGDVIESIKGADTTENRVTRRESLPIVVVQEGAGPVVALRRLGTPGVAEITRGKISGVEVSRSVITTGDAMVVVHRAATPADKFAALTFDDGPWPGQTDKILDILAQRQVKATFFMLGSRAKSAPVLARRVKDEGHLVGNHTLGHKNLAKEKPAEIRRQITAGAAAIKRGTGVEPVWFRPPYGAVNGKVSQEMRALKLRVAMWDIDTRDWTNPGVSRIVRNAVKPIKPGSVILMHDGGQHREQTVAALPQIIDELRAQGYTLVTLEQLAAAK